MVLGIADWSFPLRKTVKAFANSSPGQRPEISGNDPIRRSCKCSPGFRNPVRVHSALSAARLPRALPWAGISERFQRYRLFVQTRAGTSNFYGTKPIAWSLSLVARMSLC